MTNKEAANILKKWYKNATNGMTKERLGYIEGWFQAKDKEAFEIAIRALETEAKFDGKSAAEWFKHDMCTHCKHSYDDGCCGLGEPCSDFNRWEYKNE